MQRRAVLAFSLAFGAGLAAGCGGQSARNGASLKSISGAGASFPALLYIRWAKDYLLQTGVTVNYQNIGSGGGISQIVAKTVDFGASDEPLPPERLEREGLYQFPTVVGGVTPVINAPGVAPGALKLTGELLGDIFLGDVTRWNDPRIVSLNPGLQLPAAPITVVHRSDGSGTSFLFTSYLSLVNAGWKAKVGASDAVQWPTGLGANGNAGVAVLVRQTPGAIGYVEHAYAEQNELAFAQLKNKDGVFVSPTGGAFSAAAAHADWAAAPGNYLMLLDQAGPNTWPITGATFILLHRQPPDPAKAKETLVFFDWAYKKGDVAAANVDYVPLPQPVKDLVRRQWASAIKGSDGQPIYAPTT
jgi:phosphate transport system substrate-binding protein